MRRRSPAVAAALIGTAAALIYVLRRWQLRWGATGEEASATLAGDDIIPDADLVVTRAISVNAPADQVWPWIAQIGQGRGGFYSYDKLENLVGCDIHSANEIVPEWQDVKVGDEVKLAPEVGLEIAAVQPRRALVLRSGIRTGAVMQPYEVTWALVLQERSDTTTRLLLRERYGYARRWAPLLVEPIGAIDFWMTQRMLRGIRDRAEGIVADRN